MGLSNSLNSIISASAWFLNEKEPGSFFASYCTIRVNPPGIQIPGSQLKSSKDDWFKTAAHGRLPTTKK